jgi:hypothetical protein
MEKPIKASEMPEGSLQGDAINAMSRVAAETVFVECVASVAGGGGDNVGNGLVVSEVGWTELNWLSWSSSSSSSSSYLKSTHSLTHSVTQSQFKADRMTNGSN